MKDTNMLTAGLVVREKEGFSPPPNSVRMDIYITEKC